MGLTNWRNAGYAAPLKVLLGQFTEIMIIVILNAILGFMQDYWAEWAMAVLKEMSVQKSLSSSSPSSYFSSTPLLPAVASSRVAGLPT